MCSRILLVFLFLAGLSSAAAEPAQVTLLHVNDTHSHLLPWGPKDANLDGTLGGLARAATIVASEKAANPNALFVHAGDFFHGDPFFNVYAGVEELQLLQAVGLDVLVPGNHEFQYTSDFLTGVLNATWPGGAGGVSIVGTNLDLSEYPLLSLWISGTVIKDAGGVRVGFIGLTIDDLLARPEPAVIDERFAKIAAIAAADLRQAGAQVVVCLAHIGMDNARALAAQVPGIDLIVQGHDHFALQEPEYIPRPLGGTTILVSAGAYYRWVGRLRLSIEGSTVSIIDYQLISVDASVPPLPPIEAALAGLKASVVAQLGDVYHEVLAFADQDVPNVSDPAHAKRDTAIGDLYTDAYRTWTGTDVAVEVGGLLDEGIPAGSIVAADLFHVMDYGLPVVEDGELKGIAPARLATFTMSGAELLDVLELSLEQGGDIFPQVSGLRLSYDSGADQGHWIVPGSVHVAGAPLDENRVYSITANEVLVIAMPEIGFEPHDVQILPDSVLDAVRALVEERGRIGPGTSGRLRDVSTIPRRKEAAKGVPHLPAERGPRR